MKEYLMLQKKQSWKDNSSGLKKKDKKRKRQDEGDQREDKPKDHGSGGRSGCKEPKKEDKNTGQTPVHTDKKQALEGIAPSHIVAQYENGKCACCGMGYHTWMYYQESIVASSSKDKWPTPKDDHPRNVSSAAGPAGSTPKAQASASRRIYEVDSNNEMIIDYKAYCGTVL